MNASCSMFSQILKLIPRTDFECIVKETGTEYRSKGWFEVVEEHEPPQNRNIL